MRPGTEDWAAAQAGVRKISGKWIIPVVAALADGPRTHTDLHRTIGLGISAKVLAETLNRMQQTGLLTRQPGPATATRPYALTPAGQTLLSPLEAIATWHRHHTGPATT